MYITEHAGSNAVNFNEKNMNTYTKKISAKLHALALLLLLVLVGLQPANADVSLPYVLSSNMVVQREKGTTIWGWASSGEKVKVTFRGKTFSCKASKDGHWNVKIETGAAGGPFELVVEGNNKIVLSNILVGDVWVCSGQSNMEWPLKNAMNGMAEVRNANHPNIRLFFVDKNAALEPVENTGKTQWEVCTPLSVPDFSAVGYFFGKKIHEETGVPIGLINSNWGGTIVETWTSAEAVKQDPETAKWLAQIEGIDIEEIAREQEKIFNAYQVEYEKVKQKDWSHPYILPTFDDSKWMTANQPELWENIHTYEQFDGIMWYRKKVSLPSGFNLEKASIGLAKIDDSDILWINGHRVGETYNQYNEVRMYEIPSGVLTTGDNYLVVRVEDYTGGGGFWGLASDMYLSDGNISVDLSGNWKLMPDELKTPANPTSPAMTGIQPNQYPTLLFNGMINPIVNFAIKGAIWYQGESNADNLAEALKYEAQLKSMITDWRKHWNCGEFSFYQVQLANYMAETEVPQNDVWPYLREAQVNVAKMPGVGMACIIDIGTADDIHPRNKTDVGNRLAAISLKNDYGKSAIIASGPKVEKVTFDGNKALITFAEVADGLVLKNKYGYINGFAVAGSNKEFVYAKAALAGKNSVEVTSSDVDKIESVRFLWANNPGEINLFNSAGLPAEPFRTDSW